MDKDELLKILGDDDFGLLNVKNRTLTTVDDRLLASFVQINEFFKANGRKPQENKKDMNEHRLFTRLVNLRTSPEKVESLRAYDEHNLLEPSLIEKPITSIKDIFDDDSFGLLDNDDDIFNLKNVPKHMEMPEKIAQRKPCKDFANFEDLFRTCHEELKAGIREMRAFTGEQQITEGHFFVLHGVMVYVAEVGEKERTNGKVNARLRCIFENGTESNMLLRSLATELYKDDAGRRILDHHDKALEDLSFIKEDDKHTGYIYILSSLSTNPEISGMKDLFKIGYATTSVEDRVKNAAKEPTYLMAPIRIVTAFQCFNLNTQKLELLLHTFFGNSCLNIDVFDGAGKRYSPREWFIAPLNIIDAAVQLLINGEIVHYRYDEQNHEIVERE